MTRRTRGLRRWAAGRRWPGARRPAGPARPAGLVDGERRVVRVGRHRRQARRRPRAQWAQAGTRDHRGGVAARAQQRAGDGAGRRTVADRLDPVDQDPDDPVRAGVEAGRVAGQVVDQARRLGVDRGSGSKTKRSAAKPSRTRPRSRRPKSAAGCAVIMCTACLDGDQLAAAQAVGQEGGRVARAAHAVEVRAGVGAADHGPRVAPDGGPHGPRGLVAVVGVGPQHRAQVVGQHDVEQRVEGRRAALGGDVGHACGRRSPRWPARRCRR